MSKYACLVSYQIKRSLRKHTYNEQILRQVTTLSCGMKCTSLSNTLLLLAGGREVSFVLSSNPGDGESRSSELRCRFVGRLLPWLPFITLPNMLIFVEGGCLDQSGSHIGLIGCAFRRAQSSVNFLRSLWRDLEECHAYHLMYTPVLSHKDYFMISLHCHCYMSSNIWSVSPLITCIKYMPHVQWTPGSHNFEGFFGVEIEHFVVGDSIRLIIDVTYPTRVLGFCFVLAFIAIPSIHL